MKKTPEPTRNLNEEFASFCGTEHYFKHWLPGFVFTDGIKALADEYGAYWLIDYVLSYQGKDTFKKQEFQSWQFTSHNRSARIRVTDGNEKEICKEKQISFADLPDCQVTVWLSRTDNVLFLPSEY